MSDPVPVQNTLFGGSAVIPGLHVVQAHCRVMPDGSEVFVAEHVRWNRGRTERVPLGRSRRRRAPKEQTALFNGADDMTEPGQLGLFSRG